MKKAFHIIAAILSISASAFAKIGDTMEQSEKKYGEAYDCPKEKAMSTTIIRKRHFTKKFTICQAYIDGKCVSFEIEKAPIPPSFQNDAPFNDAEIQAILDVNFKNQILLPAKSLVEDDMDFESEDFKIHFAKRKKTISITTTAFAELLEKEDRRKIFENHRRNRKDSPPRAEPKMTAKEEEAWKKAVEVAKDL